MYDLVEVSYEVVSQFFNQFLHPNQCFSHYGLNVNMIYDLMEVCYEVISLYFDWVLASKPMLLSLLLACWTWHMIWVFSFHACWFVTSVMFVNSELSIPFMRTSSHNSIQVDVNHECGAIFSIGGDPAVSALCPGNKGHRPRAKVQCPWKWHYALGTKVSSFPPPCIHACYKNLRIITHNSFKTFFLREILERKNKTNIGLNFDTLWEQNQLINDEVEIS